MVEISVIVPVYNAQNYIQKCCENLLNQTFQNYEVIFINDGSTDQSLSMLEKYADIYHHIRIISQDNKGQAKARNKGIEAALGQFICFVDIDDEVSVDMLEKLYQAVISNDADIAWCDALVMKNNQIMGTLDDHDIHANEFHKDYFLNNASPWRKLIRKSILVEHSLFFPSFRFYEDLAIVPIYGCFADKIIYVDEPLYTYILREGSTMHQMSYDKKLEDIFKAMNSLDIYTSSKPEFHDEMEYLYIDHLLHAASLRFLKFDHTEHQLNKIVEIMKKRYPKWRNNPYYQKKNWKYKMVCTLLMKQQVGLLKMILK